MAHGTTGRFPDSEQAAEQLVGEPGMEELLAGQASEISTLRRGEIVEGVVVSASRDGLLVDVRLKSEGIVPASEMQSVGGRGSTPIRVGDEILVYVLQTENADGQAVLSLDRARTERGWRTLQRQHEADEVLESKVVDYNKGGLIVLIDGVRGFVPSSQVVEIRGDDPEDVSEGKLRDLVGRTLKTKIIEVNRRRNRLILSERQAMQEWRSEQKERLLLELQPGQIRRGRVASLATFGAFVDLGGADGLVHLSELSWERIDHPRQVLNVGDEVDVYVLSVDHENKKIALSLRRAQPEPWSGIEAKYQPGQLVTGEVTKLASFGAFARVEDGIEGLIHVSELDDERRITHPREVVREGDLVTVKIVRIEPERRRLGLSLKQARQQGDEYPHQ